MARALALSLCSLLVSGGAAAHGPPPAALAPLLWGAQGADAVQLSLGLAVRADTGFRFVCPEAWGGDAFAPVGVVPGGPVVVAAEQLYLLDAAGRATLHPEQPGVGLALSHNDDALFGLFWRDGRTELRRIDAAHSTLLHSAERPFKQLAAGTDTLSLMYTAQRTVEVQQLALDGSVGTSLSFETPNMVTYAELQVAGAELYARLYGSTAPWVTLVRIDAAGHHLVREAQASIAGPVWSPEGTLVAIDGQLQTLDDAGTHLPQGAGAVNLLGSLASRRYASDREGLKDVSNKGVGAPLFQLAALRAPQLETLPEAVREDCAFRWRDVQEHVVEAAMQGVQAEPDAGVSDAPAPEDATHEASGCALGGHAASDSWPFAFALLLLRVRRPRRR